VRREGTRTYLRTAPLEDPVLAHALAEGRRLCEDNGSLGKLPAVVAAREETSHRFFDAAAEAPSAAPSEEASASLAHLGALAPLLPRRRLAVDVGCGEGLLLDVLAPLYERVLAVDRSPSQLARAARRVRERGLAQVRLVNGSFEDTELLRQVDELGGADLVYASRVLHHASRPPQAVAAFARLLARGGHLVLLDYRPHDDEAMREQGDVWLGFSEAELGRFLEGAGLELVSRARVPDAWHGGGPDDHLRWQALLARRPLGS
jgi:ArsR family transcriptional regulator